MQARRGDVLATIGNLARATMEEAHRRMALGQQWVLNEKRLLSTTGLVELPLPGPDAGSEAFGNDFAAALTD